MSWPIQECSCCVCLCVLEKVVSTERFLYDTEKSKIFVFFEFSQNESRSFDRIFRTIHECSKRVLALVIRIFELEKKVRKIRFFWCPHDRFWRVLLSFEWNLVRLSAVAHQSGCGLATRFRQELGKEYLFEYTRGREGSTGPSRGEHRLTVYRAHASRAEEGLSKNVVNGSEKWRYPRICEFVWPRSNFPT